MSSFSHVNRELINRCLPTLDRLNGNELVELANRLGCELVALASIPKHDRCEHWKNARSRRRHLLNEVNVLYMMRSRVEGGGCDPATADRVLVDEALSGVDNSPW